MFRSLMVVCVVSVVLVPIAASGQVLSGYLQLDYLNSQESTDQLNDNNGQPLNQNRFLVRRARVKLSDSWRYLEYAVEADFNTVDGPQVGLRNVELAVVWPPHEPTPRTGLARLILGEQPPKELAIDAGEPGGLPSAAPWTPPSDGGSEDGGVAPNELDAGETLAPPRQIAGPDQRVQPAAPVARVTVAPPPISFRLGAGMFRAPFGYDTYELSNADRLFADGSMLRNAFFPGEFDVGARLSAAWRGLGLVVAVQNGEPIGEKSFPARDPNDAKDFFVRLTGHAEPTDWAKIEVGASTTVGTGFHAGTPATKDVLVWRDLNEDGIAQLTEIQAIRGSAATLSQNFDRWGIGGDLRVRFALPPGELTLFGEAALASNLDRGLRVADPVALGRAQRSITAYGGFTQEITQYFLVGVRLDYYVAALDQAQLQAGTLVRSSEPFTNCSFAAAFRFNGPDRIGRGRVLVDYTLKRDPLGRDASGRPADLKNDVFTLRLQVEL